MNYDLNQQNMKIEIKNHNFRSTALKQKYKKKRECLFQKGSDYFSKNFQVKRIKQK